MSLRVLAALVFLILGCAWTLRRPFVGVCLVIIFFHLNLRVLGTGLENIRFQYYATIVLALSYFIHRKELEEAPSPIKLPMKLLFGFLAISFITSAWAVADTNLAFESAVDFAKIVLFSYLMMKIVKTEREMHILVWVILASIWYSAFMARWGEEWGWISQDEIGIATGGTGIHYMMFFPLLILMALWGSKWEKRASYFILPFVLDAITVLPEGFRASFLAMVISMIAFLALAPAKVRKKSWLPFAVGGILFIFVFAPPGYFEYMETILNPSTESSAASRAIINHASLQILGEYPQGIGYNNYSLISMAYLPDYVLTSFGTRDAHNGYLKVATEFGILGFILWISTFIAAWVYLRRVRKIVKKDQVPTLTQLYAFAFSAGLMSITLAIYTHNYNDLDTLYWFVAFSCVLYNIQFREEEFHRDLSPLETTVVVPVPQPVKAFEKPSDVPIQTANETSGPRGGVQG